MFCSTGAPALGSLEADEDGAEGVGGVGAVSIRPPSMMSPYSTMGEEW